MSWSGVETFSTSRPSSPPLISARKALEDAGSSCIADFRFLVIEIRDFPAQDRRQARVVMMPTIPAVGRLLHFLNFVKSLLSTCPFYRPRENRAYEIPVGVGAQPPAETDYLKPAPLCPVRTFVGGIPNLATRAIVAIHLITVSSPLWRTRLSTPSRAWVWSYSYARVSSGSAAKVNGRRHTKPSDQEQIESIQGWRAQGRRRKRAPEGCHGGFPTRRRTRPG